MGNEPGLAVSARPPKVCQIMIGRTNKGDAGVLGEVEASQVTGGVGVVDGEDL